MELVHEPSPTVVSANDLDYVQARDGDRAALERVWQTHNPELIRYLRGIATPLADDVAARVWSEAAASFPDVEGGADEVRSWLFAIARRQMIDAARTPDRTAGADAAEPAPATSVRQRVSMATSPAQLARRSFAEG